MTGGIRWALASLVLGVWIPDASAWGQPLQELFETDVVYPQEQGELQVTGVYHYARVDGASRTHTAAVEMEYGITDRWELGLEWETLTHVAGEELTIGIGDVELATKYSFLYARGSSFHVAPLLSLTVPTGDEDRDLGEGVVELSPSLIVARDLPYRSAQVFLQTGIDLVPQDPDWAFFQSGGFLVAVGLVRFTQEITFRAHERFDDGESELLLTPGLVWPIAGGWEVGAGVPMGLTSDSDRVGAILMLTYERQLVGQDAE